MEVKWIKCKQQEHLSLGREVGMEPHLSGSGDDLHTDLQMRHRFRDVGWEIYNPQDITAYKYYDIKWGNQ